MFSLVFFIALLLQPVRPLHAQAERPPNVVLILTDDQGWGDVHSHGNAPLDTPVMDRLAREGVRFERFYVSPVCAPTRASLLTGRYSLRTGVHGVTRGHETMRSEEVTLAEALRQAGYATGAFGKWHNGAAYPYNPNGQGFDEFIGFSAGHWNNYFDTHLEHNGERIETEGYITDVLTDAALEFIEANRDRPFFCYVPYNTPHSPFQVPDHSFEKYRARGFDDKNAAVYGMVENLDDNIGRLLEHLDGLGLRDDTIVLFVTDNGPNGQRYNGGMRGTKGSVHEGGVRVPMFIHWPGQIEGGRVVREIAQHTDLFPTLIELTGVPMPETLPLDGTSLVPLLRNEAAGWPERTLFTHQFRSGDVQPTPGAVRTPRWRAVNYGEGWELYDMLNDPAQNADVASQYPAEVERLRTAYDAWFADVTSKGFEPVPTPIGYEERPVVDLPGHEAYLHGEGISYVGNSGWANDWLTNWTSPEAYASWPVEIVRPGRYEISVLYTAPEEAVGTHVQVELGRQQVEGTIREAHDPYPLFSPDRVLRIEVYEKPWKPLPLGTVTLSEGVTELTIRASSIPGDRAMDIKAVRVQWLGS